MLSWVVCVCVDFKAVLRRQQTTSRIICKLFHCGVKPVNKKHVFLLSIAGFVGKTVRKHWEVGWTSQVLHLWERQSRFFPHQQQIALNPNEVTAICFHMGFGSMGQPSVAWIRRMMESVEVVCADGIWGSRVVGLLWVRAKMNWALADCWAPPALRTAVWFQRWASKFFLYQNILTSLPSPIQFDNVILEHVFWHFSVLSL